MMDNSFAYSEVLEVLNNMDKKYVNKIPKKLMDYFNDNSSDNYIKHINPNVDLKEQKLSKKTLDILALINLKYWTKSEEHRKRLLKQYSENEKKLQEERKKKYNTEDLFKNKNTKQFNNPNEVALIEKKESFITKIINKFKSIFRKIK